LNHEPSGTSSRCVQHYAQLINGDKDGNPVFWKYDYGSWYNNWIEYGQFTPPRWTFENWDIKSVFIGEGEDDLGTRENINVLVNQIKSQIYERFEIPKWGHKTCLMAKDPSMMFEIVSMALAND